MDTAESYGIPHTREYRLNFSRTVQTEDISFQSHMRIYDNRKEPVDVIYQFVLLNSATENFDLISIFVLPRIYEVLPYKRLVSLVFTKVLSNKDRMALRRLDILFDKEHRDVINMFMQTSGLSDLYGDEASLYR